MGDISQSAYNKKNVIFWETLSHISDQIQDDIIKTKNICLHNFLDLPPTEASGNFLSGGLKNYSTQKIITYSDTPVCPQNEIVSYSN